MLNGANSSRQMGVQKFWWEYVGRLEKVGWEVWWILSWRV